MPIAALLAAAAAPVPCDFAHAEPTTVRAMAARPGDWLGRCVRLDGIAQGWTFYEDQGATYRASASDAADRPNDGWLGLYFSRHADFRKNPHRVEVVGTVHDCSVDYEAAVASAGADTLVMPTGYCHQSGGLILTGVLARFGGTASFVRLTGERARRRFGDLLTEAEAGPPPAEVRALAHRFGSAFRARDAQALEGLVRPYDDRTHRRGAARWRAFLLGAIGPLRRLRGTGLGTAVFFAERLPKRDLDPELNYPPDWFACYCTASGCEGRWPISRSDAQAETSRPYFCLRIYRDTEGTAAWRIGIGVRPSGRLEPRNGRGEEVIHRKTTLLRAKGLILRPFTDSVRPWSRWGVTRST